MTFLFIYTIVLTIKGIIVVNSEKTNSECGAKAYHRRQAKFDEQKQENIRDRIPKILGGFSTNEGQFPWQVSLELLHPSMGFLGHWCGAVLIHDNWVLSVAHCIHNDLFNLPLPPLWTAVLGDFNRNIESGFEQRIPIEKIIMHKRYENFQHDVVMLKLSEPADLRRDSMIRKICLPLIAINYPQSIVDLKNNQNNNINNNINDNYIYDNLFRDNYVRNMDFLKNSTKNNGKNATINIRDLRSIQLNRLLNQRQRPIPRRNDKFLHKNYYQQQDITLRNKQPIKDSNYFNNIPDLPYRDCIATGWGKSTKNGDLTDILLQTKVPIHSNKRCKEAYGDNVKIHKGHLCGGKLNGRGGTCVGDSGGPLQCRIEKNGPWILAGLTSFGSGCAEQGFPDVYTRISYYLKWISETILNDED